MDLHQVFFKVSKRLKKGFSLSPFLILLVVEGLSSLIVEFKRDGFIRTIIVVGCSVVTYLLIVDGILFGRKNMSEVRKNMREVAFFKSVRDLCWNTTRMKNNMQKSYILGNGLSVTLQKRIKR